MEIRGDIVIAGSCRTAIGKAGSKPGSLSKIHASELLRLCFAETLRRCGLEKERVGLIHEVIAGNVGQPADTPNIARVAALKAGIPNHVPAYTVQRNCGSGLQALISACQLIRASDAQVVLVGGTESMSQIPHIAPGIRYGLGFGDGILLDALKAGLRDPLTGEGMGETAENIAQKYGISREDQDAFAADSHQKAFRATREGKFRSQIVPVGIPGKELFQDEGIAPSTSRAALANMPKEYCFREGGSVHYGNACQVSDGAAAFLVLTREAADRLGIVPEAEVVGYAVTGCEPSYMGMGPATAIPAALKHAGLDIGVVDYFEINEAFAAQIRALQCVLSIPDEQLNVWGGAIALGHPVGATGAILVSKLIAILQDHNAAIGCISLCIGGGQGIAAIIRNAKGGTQ